MAWRVILFFDFVYVEIVVGDSVRKKAKKTLRAFRVCSIHANRLRGRLARDYGRLDVVRTVRGELRASSGGA